MPYLESTSINRDLVLEFFLVLSRMEFSLKLSGYATGNESKVSPDWDRFARDISLEFTSPIDPETQEAVTYYLHNPPSKQVFVDDELGWIIAYPNNGSDIEKALILVRRVRNNLFHGGKYNHQSNDETARNEELLKMGIKVLKGAMNKSDKVKRAYDGAAI